MGFTGPLISLLKSAMGLNKWFRFELIMLITAYKPGAFHMCVY